MKATTHPHITFGIMIFSLLLFFPLISNASTPYETLVPAKHVYVPQGFDSNDTSEVVIEGFLPNLCQKYPTTKIDIVDGQIDITLTALSYEHDNPFCPQMIVPFTHVVSLGVLDKGDYKIKVNKGTLYEKVTGISVEESTSGSIDDYTYARVEYIEKDKDEKTREVALKGYNPSSCFELDKIEINNNGFDTYTILPIMKQVSEFCPMKLVPFTYKVTVPKDLERQDNVLLHVRSMDGKSVNTLFNNTIVLE